MAARDSDGRHQSPQEMGGPQLTFKVTPRHLERLAMVYVRQSTPQQVLRHQESTRLQYGLVERAVSLGWPRERVVVIDDDMGKSGSTAEGRPGFQRLVAEVGLDHVGVILGVEMSRLARSCRDWHQLLEVCALFGSLICDLDGLYDPSQYNDRLLLGLKGTMSEAELHILRQRMDQGKRTKAHRGDLVMPLPMGYLRRPSGEVIKDPDEQVQSTIQLVFDRFETCGTLRGVLHYMVEQRIRLPLRSLGREDRGELQWHRPRYSALRRILNNPAYAGAYVFGQTQSDPRRKQPGHPGSGRTRVNRKQWEVFIQGRLPAYISWEQYEAHQEQLTANRNTALGAPRQGCALLSGMLRCGYCGHRMMVQYSSGHHRYTCGSAVDYGERVGCQALAGKALDERIKELVLCALEPSSLEVSMQVAADIDRERRQLTEVWQKRLERAALEADRALRQYSAVEPENRLVARTLERLLEDKLRTQKQLKDEYAQVMARQPKVLTNEEREAIRTLASDIPALWEAPTTSHADRQMIVRQLVSQVIVEVKGQSETVAVRVLWVGGHQTSTSIRRPVASMKQLRDQEIIFQMIRELRTQGLTCEEIAPILNEEGFRRPSKQDLYDGSTVRSVCCAHHLTEQEGRPSKRRAQLRKHEWRLPKLAAELGLPGATLSSWLYKGIVRGRHLDESGRPWAIYADEKELERLRALVRAPRPRGHKSCQ